MKRCRHIHEQRVNFIKFQGRSGGTGVCEGSQGLLVDVGRGARSEGQRCGTQWFHVVSPKSTVCDEFALQSPERVPRSP